MHSFESGMEYLKFTLPLFTSKIKVLSNLEWQKMLFSEHWKCPKGGLSTHKMEFPTIYISSMHFSSSNHIDRLHCSPCECNTRRFTTALYHTPNTKRTRLEKQQIPGSLQAGREFFCTDQGAFQRDCSSLAQSPKQRLVNSWARSSFMLQLNSLIQVLQTCRNVPVPLSLGFNNCTQRGKICISENCILQFSCGRTP